MKIALISDIHGNLEALDAVVTQARHQGVDAFACLGDIVGYGADPAACLVTVRGLDPVAVVQGNHDAYASDDRDLSSFNPHARGAALWTREQLSAADRAWLADLPMTAEPAPGVLLVHATPDDPSSWYYVRFRAEAAEALEQQRAPWCFYGHTHVPTAFALSGDTVTEHDGGRHDLADADRWLINVGSVGQPRDLDPRAAWTLLDLAVGTATLMRADYDIAAAQRKILDAGLPERLAERLAEGR